MNQESRKRLRELANAATPGPWNVLSGYGWTSGVSTVDEEPRVKTEHGGHGTASYTNYICKPMHGHDCMDDSDAAKNMNYIASVNPQAILSLLDRVENLERALKIIASGDIAPSSIDCYIDEYYSKLARQALKER